MQRSKSYKEIGTLGHIDVKMEEPLIKKLPLGTSSFLALRDADQIYVDKSEYIYQLASERAKFFLARPRRFGKSLLISTFEALFKNGIRDFKGLAIEKKWKDDKKYTVVRLDFSETRDFGETGEFSLKLTSLLARKFRLAGFSYQVDSVFSVTEQLSNWLKTQPANQLVILIDEYDAPLTVCLDNADKFEYVSRKLTEFYAVLKTNDRALRFLFITGITKFNKTCLFAELNDLTDISLSPECDAFLGFTRGEVQKYFGAFLESASQVLQKDKPKLVEELAEYYGGFCFEKTAKQTVFSPWSLLKFFSSPDRGFKDYWFESGGHPSVLLKHLQSSSLRNPEEYGKDKTLPLDILNNSTELNALTDVALLTQTGYLTIKTIEYGTSVLVGYPNKEVRTAMAQLYMEQLLGGRVAGQVGAGPIGQVLSEDGPESLFHILNRLFLSIDYHRFPVRDEFSVRAFVQIYFAAAGLDPIMERHNSHGRSNLEVGAGNRHWILEFKTSHRTNDLKIKLAEEVRKVEGRRFREEAFGREKICVALVYSLDKREFVLWKEC